MTSNTLFIFYDKCKLTYISAPNSEHATYYTDNHLELQNDTYTPHHQLFLCIRKLRVPTIAAINGAAVGAGAAFPLALDYRFASTSAKICFPFTRLGFTPGMGSTHLVPYLCPGYAPKLLMSADEISGEEAFRIGLVNEVLAPDELMPRALEVAERLITACAPIALLSTLDTLRMHKFAGKILPS